MNKLLTSIMVIGIAATMLGAGTFAYFSDTETSTGNTFTAGTLDISLGTATYSADIGNMQPGDTVTVSVTVTNAGTLPLDYTISTLLTGEIMLLGEFDPVVSAIRVDGEVYEAPETLSVTGGGDSSDDIEVDITLPELAGNDYQGLSGNLDITFEAIQQ